MDYKNYKNEDVLSEIRKGNNWLKSQRHLLRLKLIKKYQRDGKLFDVGCGWGHFLDTARSQGYYTMGIELAEKPYEYAKTDLNLSVVQDDFLDMIITEPKCDIVTMWDVLEHLSYPETAVKQCYKLLRPEGYLFIQVPQADSFIAKVWGSRWRQICDIHINMYTKKSIKELLNRNGFIIKRIKSSFEFKLMLMYSIKRKGSEADRQAFFNKVMGKPKWLLYPIIQIHNIIYNTISFLKIGDEMIVIAKKEK